MVLKFFAWVNASSINSGWHEPDFTIDNLVHSSSLKDIVDMVFVCLLFL